MRRATADNASDQHILVDLEPVLRSKIGEMSDSLDLDQKGDHDSALDSFRNGETREFTGDIREAIRGMDEAESELLAARSAEAARAEFVVGLLGVILLIAIVSI